MPESIIEDKYIDQIPRFNLPPELTNKEPEAEKPKEEPVVSAPEPIKEDESETTGKDPAKPTGLDNRIHRAIRKAGEAQARAEAAEKELRELKEAQAPKAREAAPRMEDYTDVQEYAKDFAAYETEKALKEREAVERTERSQKAQEKLQTDWEAKAGRT
ncbi:MAG: hypothetical protein ACRD2L_10705, partial [Terriglobia bacterium]